MPGDKRRDAGSWLEGSAFQGRRSDSSVLGLPAEGPGSLASLGQRMVGFLVDGIVANLLAGVPYLFGVHYGPGERGYVVYGAFLLQEFLLVSTVGATIGKQLVGIRVVRADGGRVPWPWVLARTVLLAFLIPAVIWDRTGRGLHDRAAGALTIRAGKPDAAATRSPQGTPSAAANGQRPSTQGSRAVNGGAKRAGTSARRRKKRR